MSEKRKINYYEIKMVKASDCRPYLLGVIELIKTQNEDKATNRQMAISRGGIFHIPNLNQVGSYIHCKARIIRDQFPEVSDKIEDTIEPIEAEEDPNKGIHEETHFVISLNGNDDAPIIAIESVMRGPRQGDIERFFNRKLVNLNFEDEFRFEPVFAFNYDEQEFDDRISDVASLKMVVLQNELSGLEQYDQSTAEFLYNGLKYGNSESILVEFKINFQKKERRHDSEELRSKARNFISVFRKNPEARKHFRKLELRGQDRKFDGKLRLFDLIEAKVASEVIAERKRSRSQYFDSNSLYAAIKEQIEKDFGI